MAATTEKCSEWRKEDYTVPELVVRFRRTIEYYKQVYNNFIPSNPSQNSRDVVQILSQLQELNGILKDLLEGQNQKNTYANYPKLMDGFTDNQGTEIEGFLPLIKEARKTPAILMEMDCARMIDLEMYPYTISSKQTKQLYAKPKPQPSAYQP
jgi:hypothetical protein